MFSIQTQKQCQQCGKPTLHAQPYIHHEVLTHMLITAFTCSLWLPVLILVAITAKNPFRCQTCGGVDAAPVAIPTPTLPVEPKEPWKPTQNQTVALVALGCIAAVGIVIGIALAIQWANAAR